MSHIITGSISNYTLDDTVLLTDDILTLFSSQATCPPPPDCTKITITPTPLADQTYTLRDSSFNFSFEDWDDGARGYCAPFTYSAK